MPAFSLRNLFNNSSIDIDPYGFVSEKVQGPFVVAHVSDLHEKCFGHRNADLFEKVRTVQPDIIAVTGDLVAHENQTAADIDYIRFTGEGLVAIAPTYVVTGNHEKRFGPEIIDALKECGVEVVDHDVRTLDIRGTKVNIGGIPDLDMGGQAERALEAFRGLEGFNLFLTHRPEVITEVAGRGIDLVLAGHTHAGQIRIPGVSSLYMMGQGFLPKFMEGEIEIDGTTMIISRGLGSSGYPTVRFNNPPDLVAVEISPPRPLDAGLNQTPDV